MKTIRVTDKQLHGQGRYGLYFRLSRRLGVKIAKNSGYVSPSLNLKTKKNQKIIKETTIGILADSPTKGLVLVQYGAKYYLGILQTHIAGKPDPSIGHLKIKNSLNQKHIMHGDLHFKNVIANKSGFHVIDFDPDYSYFTGKKQVYYTVKSRLIKSFKKLQVSP